MLRSLEFFYKNRYPLGDFILFLQKPEVTFKVGLVIPILKTKRWRLREASAWPGRGGLSWK